MLAYLDGGSSAPVLALLERPARNRLRQCRHGVGAGIRLSQKGRSSPGCDAALLENPFAWRIRLRSGLGVGFSSIRQTVLPQVGLRFPIHAREWATALGR